jgi:general secretion pathway protein C
MGLFDPTERTPIRTNVVGPAVRTGEELSPSAGANLPTVVSAVTPGTDTARFRLVGLVASGLAIERGAPTATAGIALIAIDGKPARAFRVGETVEGETILREVSALGATLGSRGAGESISLQIALPPTRATATVVPVSSTTDGVVVPNQGTRHSPLPQQVLNPAQRPVDGTVDLGDGRWTR